MRKLILLIPAILVILPASLRAQEKQLTLDILYHPTRQQELAGKSIPQYVWSDDSDSLLKYEEGNVVSRIDAISGETTVFLSSDALTNGFLTVPGYDRSRAGRAARGAKLTLDESETAALVAWGDDLYHFGIDDGRLRRVTSDPQDEEEPLLSPDGRLVAFVKEADLTVASVAGDYSRRLSTDGNPLLLNGKLDWVYQEEVYGRGRFRGFWWSPDSTRIAYLQLDLSEVPEYTVVREADPYQRLETTRYPKAGAPNPTARLGIVSVADGKTVWADLEGYGKEVLIVRMDWGPRGEMLYCQVQNREQTFLDLLEVDPESGKSRLVLRETTPGWVNVLGEPHWLSDESFLWESERSGFRHLYRINRDGEVLFQLTDGEWEVRGIASTDENSRIVYFTGTRDSSIEKQLYSVSLDGGEITRISERTGTHEADFSPGSEFYLDRWSNIATPPQLSLHRSSGEKVRALHDSRHPDLEEYQLGEVEFLEIPARDGFLLPSMIVRPSDFDPARPYPVLVPVYGGPQSPSVANRWGGTGGLWYRYLAQEGFIVWLCDNRSASGKGAAAAWPIHRRLGESELQDLEDAVRWMGRQPFVDSRRIAVYGWSYGGYLTAYALTRSNLFRAGIVGAPVTDWRFYDSIYTERYMGLPQDNREGYRKSSVVEAAEGLEGALFLIHGTADDNVHPANTIELVKRLQEAGKIFDLMLYPGSRHGVRDKKQLYHLRRMMLSFLQEELSGEP